MELREDLCRVENKVDVLTETVSELDSNLDDLEEYTFGWTEFAETYLLAIRGVLESSVDDVDDFNECLREYDS